MSKRLVWNRDGLDWPNREASRFVTAGGLTWHVQVMGNGPVILLIHGTGASTHSWRDVLPRLALTHTVVAPDLPGHGFTSSPDAAGFSLPGMARGLSALMTELDLRPEVAVGHSAGAAILIRAALDRRISPSAIISLNGALLPFGSVFGMFFSPVAKLLVSAPTVPSLLSWRAEKIDRVERILRGTGSRIDAIGLDLYARLFRNPGHVAAALGMMANWDLRSLTYDLPRLRIPLFLIAGGEDTAIPPQQTFRVRDMLPSATTTYLRGLGHLAHEEDPETVSGYIERVAARQGVPARKSAVAS
ncbi:MAG: alpha/beta fold hydrolase [Hyphomicrobiaceae bacterium]|nr:alpha/beta fold hydrolase [Hyphomicrobiaceae bacterium]